MIEKLFPLNEQAKKDVVHLLVVLAVYFVASRVISLVLSVIAIIPIISIICYIVGRIVGLYCLVGAVVAILAFFKVV